MKSYIYFIGGSKDGEVYQGKLMNVGESQGFHDPINPQIKDSQTNFFCDGKVPDKPEFKKTLYKLEVFDEGRLFLVDTLLDRRVVLNKVKKYLRK
ncbi:hypothetical protein [Acinetobacter pittii]